MKGPKICNRGAAPWDAPSGKILYPKSALGTNYVCAKFQFSISNSFRDMTGSQIYPIGGC